MHLEHLADLLAFAFIAVAPGKPFELNGSRGMRFGEDAPGNLWPKTIEKIDQRFEITVHNLLDAAEPIFCRIFSAIARNLHGFILPTFQEMPAFLRRRRRFTKKFCKIVHLERLTLRGSGWGRCFKSTTDGR